MDGAQQLLEETSLANTWVGIAILFAAFCFFCFGSLGYGLLLRRAWRRDDGLLETISDSFLLASAFLWFFASLLASAHWLGVFPSWSYWLFFLPGFLASFPRLREVLSFAKQRHSLYLALFVFIFLLRALSASIPARLGDPLLYHLLGPRLWMEAGGFTMHPQLPNALLASTWEILYLWPQMLWYSSRPLYGLVEAQIFSQWLHLSIAWAGSALLVMRLFQPSLRTSLLPLAGLAALFVSGLHWTAAVAKNDVGIALWALGALIYFQEFFRKCSPPYAALSGFFAGLAVSGKITALFTLGPLMAGVFVSAFFWKKWRLTILGMSLWVVSFLVGALPAYVRNFLLSGNPLYPMFPKLFPSPHLAPSYEAFFAQVQPSNPLHSMSRIWERAPELWRESPFIFVAIFLLAFVLISRAFFRPCEADSPPPVLLLTCSTFAYVIFVITQIPRIELRYIGASLQILTAGGVVMLLREAYRFPSARLRQGATSLILVAILATSKLPLHILGKIWREPLGTVALLGHSAGEAKAWLRKNAGAGFTVMAGDNESYYLTPVAHAVLSERADIDRATRNESDFPRFVNKLCEVSHAKFLFDARPENGMAVRFGAAIPQEAVVFSAQGAKVYDLGKLEELLSPSSRACPR